MDSDSRVTHSLNPKNLHWNGLSVRGKRHGCKFFFVFVVGKALWADFWRNALYKCPLLLLLLCHGSFSTPLLPYPITIPFNIMMAAWSQAPLSRTTQDFPSTNTLQSMNPNWTMYVQTILVNQFTSNRAKPICHFPLLIKIESLWTQCTQRISFS